MRILAVDTTTSSGSTALLDGRRLVAEACSESPATHSARLLAAVDHLLKAAGLEIGAVDGYAVAAGPGSFTGIRIGLSTVKSLSFASGKPIAPVSSLRALALKLAGSGPRLICPVLDAKKGEIYSALYETVDGRLVEKTAQGAYDPHVFFSALPGGVDIQFIGGGVSVHREALLAGVGARAVFPARTFFVAHEVGILGAEIFDQGLGVAAGGLEPFYFRKSQAEEHH
jgi:tRNA threonylcarbamoyladenosine biosynthesis protein TsaB